MAYFDGIKVGDKVWHFEYGWGVVIKTLKASDLDNQNFNSGNDFNLIEVKFDNEYFGVGYFDFNGVVFYSNGNQTLFWDEIKFKTPERPNIKLKETSYEIDLVNNRIYDTMNVEVITQSQKMLCRDDEKTAEKILKQIKGFVRLLALRDQECPNSRGYEFQYGKENWFIYASDRNIDDKKYAVHYTDSVCFLNYIFFKNEEDAHKICDILNSGRFSLEGE